MFISIVIPTYNRAPYLHKTISSLLNQTYLQYEIIVVDDGSTDNTEDIMRTISDTRVKYFKKENAERAAARNYGMRKAVGEYVNFFDSDDVAYSNHLMEACNAIENLKNPEVFHLGYDIKDAEGGMISEKQKWPLTINDQLINGNHLSCNGIFIRKDIAEKFPFNENRLLSASEDYELWLRLASRFPFHCISVMTSTVVNHEFRSVLQINAEKFVARIELLQQALEKDDMVMQHYGRQWNLFKSYLSIYMALHLAMARYPKSASLRHLRSAVLLRPRIFFTRRFLAALKNIWI
jgi:glycosyltransferase involved in cell wall biosynthesis